MSNITGRLINAERVQRADGYVIRGAVYEDVHHRFHDGAIIHTSQVVSEDGPIVLTRNSIYEIESWRDQG